MHSFKIKELVEKLDINEKITDPIILNKPIRFSIFMTDLGNESEYNKQSGIRPCIVWNNYEFLNDNNNSQVIPLTSKLKSLHLPCHVVLKSNTYNGLKSDSMALLEQISIIDNNELLRPIGFISYDDYLLLFKAWEIQIPPISFINIKEKEKIHSENKLYFDIINIALNKK